VAEPRKELHRQQLAALSAEELASTQENELREKQRVVQEHLKQELQKYQAKRERKRQRRQRNKQIAVRYKDGESVRELGRAFGISHELVRYVLLSLGVKLRTSREGRALKYPVKEKPQTLDWHEVLTAEWLRMAFVEHPEEPSLIMVASWIEVRPGDVPPSAIGRACRYHAIPVRSQSEARSVAKKHNRLGHRKEKSPP
jgi:phage-related minor tail protein